MLKQQRLLSLDVFRGMTIMAMVMVNNPGSWSHVYAPLLHAEWHGATPTDWVFPFFIFIVGVSIAFALGSRKAKGADKGPLIKKVLIRTGMIFGLGLLLHLVPSFKFDTLRIPGVLQRIALVYGAASLLFIYVSPRQLLGLGVGFLLLYWALLILVPVPGGVAPNLEPSTNLGAWIDRMVFGENHLWSHSKTWDPEGLLGTIPAITNAIFGILVGLWFRKEKSNYEKVAGLMVAGLTLLGVSLIWDWWFPINKSLWTSSYVLYTSGIAMLILGVIYWLVDIKNKTAWIKPFRAFGMNALFIYLLSGLIAKFMFRIKFDVEGEMTSLHTIIWEGVFLPVFQNPKFASFMFAISHMLVLLVVAWVMYRKEIFVKV